MKLNGFPAPVAILFDWDGTLVDSLQHVMHLHNTVRVRMGFEAFLAHEFHFVMKSSSREMYPLLYGDDAPRAFEYLKEEIAKNPYAGQDIVPKAHELLTLLREKTIPAAVVSNMIHERLQLASSQPEWQGFFGAAIGAGRATRDKPAPDPAFLALEEIGFTYDKINNTETIWFIGDTDTDVATAEAGGFSLITLGDRPSRSKTVRHQANFATLADFYDEFADFIK